MFATATRNRLGRPPWGTPPYNPDGQSPAGLAPDPRAAKPFGMPDPWHTPGIGDGIGGAGPGMPIPDLGPVAPDVASLPTTKPEFFGQGGVGRGIAGTLGDALLTLSGGKPIYAPAMQRRQELAIKERNYQRERRDRLADWTAQQDYKQKHPDDQFTQYLTAAGVDPRSPQGQEMYRKRAENMAAPTLMAVDGFDAQGNPTKTFMPRAGIGTGGPPAPAGPAVGTVKNGYRFNGGNPNDRTSWVPVGGASPSGGATFR